MNWLFFVIKTSICVIEIPSAISLAFEESDFISVENIHSDEQVGRLSLFPIFGANCIVAAKNEIKKNPSFKKNVCLQSITFSIYLNVIICLFSLSSQLHILCFLIVLFKCED